MQGAEVGPLLPSFTVPQSLRYGTRRDWRTWDWGTTGLAHKGLGHDETGVQGAKIQRDWRTRGWDITGLAHKGLGAHTHTERVAKPLRSN